MRLFEIVLLSLPTPNINVMHLRVETKVAEAKRSQHTERWAQGEFHKCTLNLFNSILNLEPRWNALTHSLATLSRSKVFYKL